MRHEGEVEGNEDIGRVEYEEQGKTVKLQWILNPEQCRPVSNADRYTIVVRDLRALRGKDEERRICHS